MNKNKNYNKKPRISLLDDSENKKNLMIYLMFQQRTFNKYFKQFLHIPENRNLRFQIKDNFIFLQKFIKQKRTVQKRNK